MDPSDPLFGLSIVLFCGILGGELLGRLKLPKVTGWIGTGIALRAIGIPGLEPDSLGGYAPFTSFVLGYIAFTVGATLNLASLRNAGRRLSLLLLAEATITPTVVALLLIFVGGLETNTALILAAIAIAGAPGTTVIVIREARARGILSRTLIAAVGLIDMVAVAAFVLVTKMQGGGAADAALAVGLEFTYAFVIGGGIALLALVLCRWVIGPVFLGPTMVAVILGSWGTATAFGVSSILCCTVAGIIMSNVRHETAVAGEGYLTPFGGVLFAGFYTLAGMRLDFGLVLPVAGLVALFFVGRLVGKSLGGFLAMSGGGAPPAIRRTLGLALLPHGGVAVGLIFLVQADPNMADIADTVVAVGLAALAINQLLGPSATRFSLNLAGEAGKDRPRLLDFVKEQTIITNLSGTDPSAVLRTLTDRLYATGDLPIPKQKFLEQVIERELDSPTRFGDGLMIPHVTVEGLQEMTGVLGLSGDGLDFTTPDGKHVHAVFLIATPARQRDRHLEVLSALAKVTNDDSLREQRYQARNAAHAYDVLHAREAEDLNFFLEGAIADAFEDDPLGESSAHLPRLEDKP